MVDEDKKKRSAEEDKKILERARQRWKQADEAESENRRKQVDDMKFAAASPDDNFQWPQLVLDQRLDRNQEGGPRPCLTINKIPTHIRQVTNEQRMNRPQIRVQPVDDKADPEVAEILNGIIRHIQVASEADLAYDTACDQQVAAGEGYFRILTEYCDEMSFDQDIVIAPLGDRMKVYMDPIGLMAHPAGRKCQWGFIVEDVPKEDYEDDYGDEHPVDWNLAGVGDQADWYPNKKTVRIAEYFEIEKKPATLLGWEMPDGTTVTAIEGEPLPAGVNAAMVPRKRKTKLPRCMWRKITGQHVIDEREMPTKYIPIIRVVGNQWVIEGKPIVSGLTRNAKDAQRMYNYNASTEVEINGLAPKAPWIGMAEQFEGHEDKWRASNRVSYAYLPYNAVIDEATGQIVSVQPPQRAQPAMPQAAIITAKMAAADDIKSTTGQFDPSLGNNPQAKSGIALQREQVKSEVGTFHYVDNLARALRYAGTIILDMIPRVMPGKRIARILGEDGKPDHVVLDSSIGSAYEDVTDEAEKKIGKVYNIGVGKYDVVVSTGPSFTTKRQEAAADMTALVQASPQLMGVIGDLYFRALDMPYAEEFAKRMKVMLAPPVQELIAGEEEGGAEIPPEVKAALEQAEQQIANVTGQMQAAQQAVAERDKTVMELKGKLDGRNVDAMAKVYEADKKAEAEIYKARAEVEVAKVNAVTAAAAQPENTEMQALIAHLDEVLKAYDAKLEALAQHSAAIAQQLQAFEIAATTPLTNAA